MKLLALPLIGLTLVSAAPAPVPASRSATCQKLHREFITDEVAYAVIWSSQRSLAESADIAGDKGSSRRNLIQQEASTEQFLARGRDLTQLMIANQCQPPDHIMSPHTYANDFAACDQARQIGDAIRVQELCNVTELAWKRAGF